MSRMRMALLVLQSVLMCTMPGPAQRVNFVIEDRAMLDKRAVDAELDRSLGYRGTSRSLSHF